MREGAIFQSTSDTEVIIHLAARSKFGPVVHRVIDALKQVTGAYSLVALTSKKLSGARDPWGVRPLVAGRTWMARRSWRPRPARSTSSARASCATWSRAR